MTTSFHSEYKFISVGKVIAFWYAHLPYTATSSKSYYKFKMVLRSITSFGMWLGNIIAIKLQVCTMQLLHLIVQGFLLAPLPDPLDQSHFFKGLLNLETCLECLIKTGVPWPHDGDMIVPYVWCGDMTVSCKCGDCRMILL